jgi:hypothetical protein
MRDVTRKPKHLQCLISTSCAARSIIWVIPAIKQILIDAIIYVFPFPVSKMQKKELELEL